MWFSLHWLIQTGRFILISIEFGTDWNVLLFADSVFSDCCKLATRGSGRRLQSSSLLMKIRETHCYNFALVYAWTSPFAPYHTKQVSFFFFLFSGYATVPLKIYPPYLQFYANGQEILLGKKSSLASSEPFSHDSLKISRWRVYSCATIEKRDNSVQQCQCRHRRTTNGS